MELHSSEARRGPFDVLALAASAGGHVAVLTLLKTLPPDFAVPIVLLQHLAPEATSTVDIYARQSSFAVEWARSGAKLTPRKVLVCPGRSFLGVLPDGSCVISPCERGAIEKPIDRFLDSVARSFSHRAIGVILSGMGNDGSVGAGYLHRAGGRLLVQSEATAEYAEMPRAAIEAGVVDMVVPLADLGQVIGEIVAGTPRPKTRSEIDATSGVFGDRGEVARLANEIDWEKTPLGPVFGWSPELRMIARTLMESSHPTAVWWGPQFLQIYNEAWRTSLGEVKHPQSLGAPARESWREIWADIKPILEQVLEQGQPVSSEDHRLLIKRHGVLEEVYVTFSYSPIRDATGAVRGVHIAASETTRNVVAERRMRALRTLAAGIGGASTTREACERAAKALGSDQADTPFALLYLVEKGYRHATLGGAAGIEIAAPAAPQVVKIVGEETLWPLSRVLKGAVLPGGGGGLIVDDLATRFPGLATSADLPLDTLPPRSAALFPLRPVSNAPAIGVLVLALSPHRPLDEVYRSFLDLVAQQINSGLAEAQVRQLERERTDRLAELDRAKTEFFANVSHEFRTPLTLMLAPLEELLRRREDLPASLVQEIDVAAQNSRRLLTLVNNLLDFSQIEARRHLTPVQPVDLGAVTKDIASAFRSAIEGAGLRFQVECDPKLPPVPVNREMWEKIVSNLLSNAFKFTFAGKISLELRARTLHAELVVSDTGIGIPEAELPNIFKRFHRVRGARARTAEGSGIGLAIVHDLVTRMGGQVNVRSQEGKGTEFTLWLPFKAIRHFTDPNATPATSAGVATDLAKEASRWLDTKPGTLEDVADDLLGLPTLVAGDESGPAKKARIVVADDNPDMRAYLQRLLQPRWEVELAVDGSAALEAIRRERPDVILADVMMPGLDGFELLRSVREDAGLKQVPVVLLTARAGEEAAIEGLLAGADDYVAKPFSPRELLVRVSAVVDRSRAEAALRKSEEKFRTLFETIDEGFCRIEMIFDSGGRPVDLIVLDVNSAYEKQSGLIAADVIGRRVTEYAPNLEREWIEFYGNIARTGQAARMEYHAAPLGKWLSVYAQPLGGRGSPQLVVVFTDVTDRKRAEERQAFLLQLSDALRAASGEDSIAKVAVELTAAQMKVDRCWIAVLIPGEDRAVVAHDHRRDDLQTMRGEYRYSDFPETTKKLKTGTLAFDNIQSDSSLTAADKAGFAGLRIGAQLAAFLRKGAGRVRWSLTVANEAPRAWSREEEALLEEAAERTWAAVERARTEEARRLAEERLLAASEAARVQITATLESIGDAFYAVDAEFRLTYVNAKAEVMWGRPRETLIGRNLWSEFPLAVGGEPHARHLAAMHDRRPAYFEGISPVLGRWMEANLYPDPVSGGLACYFRDITERRAAETALRESAERQAFLLKLTDALRPHVDAARIIQSACRVLGEHTKADRALYADVSDEQTVVIGPNHVNGVPPIELTLNAADFGQGLVAAYKRGEKVIFSDVNTVPAFTEQDRLNFASLGVVANVSVPLVKAGRWVGVMGLHQCSPRNWTPREIELVEETAERVWTAIERARAEAALRASEEKYRALFESMDEGFFFGEAIFDENGICTDLFYLEENPAAIRMVGQSFKGRRLSELGSYEQYWLDIFGRTARTGEAQHRELYAAPDRIWYEFHVFKPAQAKANQFAVVFHDVTARHKAVEAARESERRMQLALQAGAMGTYVWDPQEDRGEQDAQMMRLFGRDVAIITFREVLGEIVHPEDRQWYAATVQKSLDPKGDGRLGTDFRVIHPDGSTHWLHIYGQTIFAGEPPKPVRMHGVAFDITEQKRAEERLRTSEAEFRTLAEAAPAFIWVCAANGENIYFNDRWYEHTGQTRQEASGFGWAAMMHPEDSARLLPYWERCRQTGEIYEGEVRYRRHDGTYRWHRFRALPRRSEAREIKAWYGASIDTDDAKRAEEALRKSEEKYGHRIRFDG